MGFEPRKRVLKSGKVKWDARWRDTDGTWVQAACDSLAEAKSLTLQREFEVAKAQSQTRPSVIATTTLTVGEYLQLWLTGKVATAVAIDELEATTAAGYVSVVERLTTYLGNVRLLDLHPWTCSDAWNKMVLDGLAKKTVSNTRGVLSKALSDAIQDRIIDNNAASLSKAPTVRKSKPKTISPDERAALLSELMGHRLGNAFLFFALTGVRASEQRGLRWDDVDLDAGTYAVEMPLHYIPPSASHIVGDYGIVAGHGKTARSTEETPLSDPAVEVLRAQRRQQAEERLAARRWERDDLVFTTTVGTPLTHSAMTDVLVRAADKVGVTFPPRQKLQVFRKSFATDLADAKVGDHILQSLGRWTNPETPRLHYIHARLEEERAALRAVYPNVDRVLGY